MNRLVAPATAMPRPAKLARQTRQATTRQVFLRRRLWTPSLRVLRAFLDCRAGFAGRDMPQRSPPCSHPRSPTNERSSQSVDEKVIPTVVVS
jgi:hypothetical protein